jgi:hypothetical protein
MAKTKTYQYHKVNRVDTHKIVNQIGRNCFHIKLTQVAKNHFAFATALLWHYSFEITLKLYLYGKYSIQTMIFWSLCAFIWFANMKKMLLQITSGFLQLESTINVQFIEN